MRTGMEKVTTRIVDWAILLVVLAAWGLLVAIPSPPLSRGATPEKSKVPIDRSDFSMGATPEKGEGTISLPDFSQCTRIETWFVPSTYTTFTDNGRYASLMNAEELERLQVYEKGVADDAESIAEVAAQIAEMHASGIVRKPSSYVPAMAWIACYEGAKRTASIPLIAQGYRMVRGSWWVDYGDERLAVLDLAPELKPLALRLRCASVLESLADAVRDCPTPETWSDVFVEGPSELVKELTDIYGAEYVRKVRTSFLQCPSAGEGRCHYAVNPNCELDSPPDMVLLFETKAGWNQHGGAELFTFDNHDPKGGCVLLNDGTVKFIRTEEELHALRWK